MPSLTTQIFALKRRKRILKKYTMSAFSIEDWHGVSDAANDLRVVDEKIKGLRRERRHKLYEDSLQVRRASDDKSPKATSKKQEYSPF